LSGDDGNVSIKEGNMATLTNSIFGKISGSLGDVIFRHIRGKVFIVNRPAAYTVPQDAASIKTRGIIPLR
jgi:hypothetical protein